MRFRVLDAASPDDRAAWLALWERWPDREIMAHPDFASLFARPCDRVVCAVGESDARTVLFPLVLRPLAAETWAEPGERRWDATTPYGYGGPFAWGAGALDDGHFWRAHAAWCGEEGIVSTFVRLSLFQEELAAVPWRVEERLANVVVPLDGGADALWKGYEGKVRRWVRTAEAAGLEVEIDRAGAHLDAFARVYEHTMRRRGAADWYFFPRAAFEQIVTRLAGHFAFFHAKLRGEVVSSDLVLCSARRVYYFLGGTLDSAFDLGPNYLVKHKMLLWAAAEKKQQCVLGGGYEPGDGLYRYKRAYARGRERGFQVALAVHDEGGYRGLVDRRSVFAARQGSAWAPRPPFFPAYRG